MPDATTVTPGRPARRDPFVRIYSSAPDAPRLRRPADVLMLLVALVVLALLAIPAPGPSDLDTALVDLVPPGVRVGSGWPWAGVEGVEPVALAGTEADGLPAERVGEAGPVVLRVAGDGDGVAGGDAA